jgi:hypothetical protein
MIDLKLKNNDLYLDRTRNLAIAKDVELVRQNIILALNLLNGKYYYDSERGVDWYQFMQNTGNVAITIFITDYLYSIDGVAKVYSIMPTIDQNRKMVIRGVIEDDSGNLIRMQETLVSDFNLEVEERG